MCRGGFSITIDFSPDITCFFTPTWIFGALPYPLGRCCMSQICVCCPQLFLCGDCTQLDCRVFVDGRFASARMASTVVLRSSPVMVRPALHCDLSRFSDV